MAEDYLKRLKESKKELSHLAEFLKLKPDSKRDKAIQTAIKLLEKEIKDVEYFRQF